MKRITFAFLAAALLLTGCWQKSLHPFYTLGDLAPDRQLIGRWESATDTPEEDPQQWRFKQASPDSYSLEITDTDGKKCKYVVHLFRFQQKRFLDFVPEENGVSGIPAHHLFQVSELGRVLKIAPLNIKWMRDFLTANPNAVQHVRLPDPGHRDDREKDELVLTAETPMLQDFLQRHLDEPDFFGEAEILHKVTRP